MRLNYLATVLLSQGVPMVLAGDELGRSQRCNPNAYNRDDESSWVDWGSVDEGLRDAVQRLIGLRRDHPVFRRRTWFGGPPENYWLRPDGAPMQDGDWSEETAHSFTLVLDGAHIPESAPDGTEVGDDSFALLFNAYWEPLTFTAPAEGSSQWVVAFDTDNPGRQADAFAAGAQLSVAGRSLVLLMARASS
jgi:isoamylase